MGTQVNPFGSNYPATNTADISSGFKYSEGRNPSEPIRVGVIGYGYWGPNVVRNFQSLENCHVAAICDKNPAALRRANRLHSGAELTSDSLELLTSPRVDVI